MDGPLLDEASLNHELGLHEPWGSHASSLEDTVGTQHAAAADREGAEPATNEEEADVDIDSHDTVDSSPVDSSPSHDAADHDEGSLENTYT